MKPPHPPVPEGMYECPDCDFHPGRRSMLPTLTQKGSEEYDAFLAEQKPGYVASAEDFFRFSEDPACPTCKGTAAVTERRKGKERRGTEAIDRRKG